jgi:hypothetical protein
MESGIVEPASQLLWKVGNQPPKIRAEGTADADAATAKTGEVATAKTWRSPRRRQRTTARKKLTLPRVSKLPRS